MSNRITFKIPAGRTCGEHHKECPFCYDGIACRLFDGDLLDVDDRTQKCEWCFTMFPDGYTVTIER